MTPLSPAAQAVLDAFLVDAENTGLQMDDLRENVAFALRAAADHLDAESPWPGHIESTGVNWSRNELHKIATELEAQP
jgi:hypothetical protein